MNITALFDNSPIPLWEKDYQKIKLVLDTLKETLSEEQLIEYIETHPQFIQEMSHSIKIVDVNQKVVSLLKAKNKEQVKERLQDIFTPESYQVIKGELISIVKKKDFENESIIRSFDGELVPIYITAHYPSDEDFSSILVSTIDLRCAFENHKKLLNVSRKYQSLIELTGTAFIILNHNYDIIDSNARFRNILGLDDKLSIIGRNPRSWLDHDSVKIFDDAISEIEKGNSPQNIEVLFTGKAGNNLLISRSIWLNFIMSKVENGQKIIFCLVQDIGHKKLAEMKRYIHEQKRKDLLKQNIYKIRDQINGKGDMQNGN